jgi:hypothetical protein
MDDAPAALACGAYLLAKAGEIRRKYGWCQFDQTRALRLLNGITLVEILTPVQPRQADEI